jgi:hypothetical protein
MMTAVRTLPILLVAACTFGGDSASTTEQAIGGNASVSLHSASASISQTAATSWTLSKTGSVDTSAQTVTWQITATQGSTVGGQLHFKGRLNVTNTGSGPATIGNILVNLQTRSGHSWTTVSSDVNDATSGDAATAAHIYSQASSENSSEFSENAASGPLQFTDAHTNTLFSLVPEVSIPAGGTVPLLFDATFDNTALHLATGTPVRAEVIVSFGNHGPHGAAGANIDINGNGVIDADEAYVRSVPARLGLTVPAQTGTTGTPTLSDALADITSTGTVTLGSASFNLGATSGTVSIHYAPGTDGGDITNCAHLTGGGGLNLQACNTQSVTGTGTGGCTDGQPGCGWSDGDLTTYPQGLWDTNPSAVAILANGWLTVYPGSVVEIGIPGAAGFSIRFTDPSFIHDYLPAVGVYAALTGDLINPTTSSSGALGADVLSLQLNVDFSDHGLMPATTSYHLGDLFVCGATDVPAASGMTVRDILALANSELGGGAQTLSYADLDTIVTDINGAFAAGTVGSFAQAHLAAGGCP